MTQPGGLFSPLSTDDADAIGSIKISMQPSTLNADKWQTIRPFMMIFAYISANLVSTAIHVIDLWPNKSLSPKTVIYFDYIAFALAVISVAWTVYLLWKRKPRIPGYNRLELLSRKHYIIILTWISMCMMLELFIIMTSHQMLEVYSDYLVYYGSNLVGKLSSATLSMQDNFHIVDALRFVCFTLSIGMGLMLMLLESYPELSRYANRLLEAINDPTKVPAVRDELNIENNSSTLT